MEQEPKAPMTAGEWAQETKRERTYAAFFLLTFGLCGLSGAMGAMAVFGLGEVTGTAITDVTVLVFVLLSSIFALTEGSYLIEGPMCRACGTPLKESQFRCGECATLVSDPRARS
jgi:hypothetical protein